MSRKQQRTAQSDPPFTSKVSCEAFVLILSYIDACEIENIRILNKNTITVVPKCLNSVGASLYCSCLCPRALPKVLNSVTRLLKLDISNIFVGEYETEFLSSLITVNKRSIQVFNLRGNCVNGKIIAALKTCPNLQKSDCFKMSQMAIEEIKILYSMCPKYTEAYVKTLEDAQMALAMPLLALTLATDSSEPFKLLESSVFDLTSLRLTLASTNEASIISSLQTMKLEKLYVHNMLDHCPSTVPDMPFLRRLNFEGKAFPIKAPNLLYYCTDCITIEDFVDLLRKCPLLCHFSANEITGSAILDKEICKMNILSTKVEELYLGKAEGATLELISSGIFCKVKYLHITHLLPYSALLCLLESMPMLMTLSTSIYKNEKGNMTVDVEKKSAPLVLKNLTRANISTNFFFTEDEQGKREKEQDNKEYKEEDQKRHQWALQFPNCNKFCLSVESNSCDSFYEAIACCKKGLKSVSIDGDMKFSEPIYQRKVPIPLTEVISCSIENISAAWVKHMLPVFPFLTDLTYETDSGDPKEEDWSALCKLLSPKMNNICFYLNSLEHGYFLRKQIPLLALRFPLAKFYVHLGDQVDADLVLNNLCKEIFSDWKRATKKYLSNADAPE